MLICLVEEILVNIPVAQSTDVNILHIILFELSCVIFDPCLILGVIASLYNW
jgi:hypothetical protein